MMTSIRRAGRGAVWDQPLQGRLAPLRVAVFLHGFMLWPPVEKLFMTEIDIDATSIA